MPVTKKNDKWYWGSKGPYNSRKQAEEVQRAAYASGYGVQQKIEKIEMGAPMDGEKRKETVSETQKREKQLIRKEDGGGGEGFGGTAFTSTNAGIFNPTFGEKKKKKTGVERLNDFVTDSSPLKLSKFTATGAPGHLGPVRIDWDKRKLDEEDKQKVVEREGHQDKDSVVAQKAKDQQVADIQDDAKEKDFQLQYGFGTLGGQNDALHRANEKDILSRDPRDEEDEEEEESTIPEETDLTYESSHDKIVRKSLTKWSALVKEFFDE